MYTFKLSSFNLFYGYFEIDEPECVKHLCSFAIG